MEDRGSDPPAALDAGAAAAASPGSRPERTQDAADAPFDVAGFQQYLKQLLPLVIQADERDLDPLLEADEFKDRAARWATDPNAGALYVVKSRSESVDDAAQGMSICYSDERRGRPTDVSPIQTPLGNRSSTRCRRPSPTRPRSPRPSPSSSTSLSSTATSRCRPSFNF